MSNSDFISSLDKKIENCVSIDAPPSVVWTALTDPRMMKQWMAEPEMKLGVETNWQVGSPIVITGFHHKEFVNRGTVLHFEPPALLRYTHLSSLSRLPDQAGSYSIIEFKLTAARSQTQLMLMITNFPTPTILKHLEFYWTGTLLILKEFVEMKDPNR